RRDRRRGGRQHRVLVQHPRHVPRARGQRGAARGGDLRRGVTPPAGRYPPSSSEEGLGVVARTGRFARAAGTTPLRLGSLRSPSLAAPPLKRRGLIPAPAPGGSCRACAAPWSGTPAPPARGRSP